ncbi:MAG: GerAB/ArcD/ProY family transporter [Bacillota bacterium]
MDNGKISQRQLAYLFFTVLIATVVFYNPQIVVGTVGRDAWITALLGSVWGLLVMVVIVALGRRFPDKTMTGYFPQIIGKPLGTVLSLLYTVWFLFVGAGLASEFALFMNTTIMPDTPGVVFIVTFMAVAFYAVSRGLEVFVRVNELLVWAIVASMIIVVALPWEFMDLRRLLPIGETSVGNLIATSLIAGTWRGEVFLAGMFLPALVTMKNTTRNLAITVVLIGFFLMAVQVSTVAVFGSQIVGDIELPAFSLARLISTARVLDRLEALVVVIWVFATFIKICAFLYCANRAVADTMGFQEHRFLLLPITLLFTAMAYSQIVNPAQLVDFLTITWPGYGLLSFELVIPLVLLLIASLRGKREKKS